MFSSLAPDLRHCEIRDMKTPGKGLKCRHYCIAGADPTVFALTVAIATSNSFLIPTHQVNAFIMWPAGYRVADFLKAGSIMTVLFLVVMMLMMNLIF